MLLASLLLTLQLAHAAGLEAPSAIETRTARTRLFERSGFEWESDASAALSQAEHGFRAAGLAVVSAQVVSQNCPP